MADYYPVLARAVAGLDPTSSESRREIYERARKALVEQLRSLDPPLSESEITRERLSLEDAVRRIEAGARPHPTTAPLAAPAKAAAAAPAPKAEVRVGPPAAPPAPRPAKAAPVGPPAPQPVGPPTAEGVPPVAAAPAPAAPAISEPLPPAAAPSPSGPAGSPPRKELAFGGVELRRSRWPAIAAGVVILLVAAIGGGAYLARDQLADMLTATPMPAKNAVPAAPQKIVERVGTDSGTAAPAAAATDAGKAATPAASAAASAPAVAPAEAPAAPAPQNTTVAKLDTPPAQSGDAAGTTAPAAAQRAILYEETSDRQSGSAFVGTAKWSLDTGITEAGRPRQTALVADVVIPERKLRLKMTIKRNTDQTLPASHTIDLQFTLPSDFANGGIANVPGILFKPTEEAGGQALAALSVRVMDNFFLIGLSNSPTEQAKNLAAIRNNGWIDLPILYDNGRRAVLTLGKGATGTKAFEQALAAWQQEAATAANTPAPGQDGTAATPSATPSSGH